MLSREELWNKLCMINHPDTDKVGHPHLRASEVYHHDAEQRARIAELEETEREHETLTALMRSRTDEARAITGQYTQWHDIVAGIRIQHKELQRIRGILNYALGGPDLALRQLIEDALNDIHGCDDYEEKRTLLAQRDARIAELERELAEARKGGMTCPIKKNGHPAT